MTMEETIERLTAENAAMRPIVLRMAEVRMCRDNVMMLESCPHCSPKRGGEYGYSGTHEWSQTGSTHGCKNTYIMGKLTGTRYPYLTIDEKNRQARDDMRGESLPFTTVQWRYIKGWLKGYGDVCAPSSH